MSDDRPTVTLVRHGETPWSATGQHTGRTDLDLTPAGVQQAEDLRPLLARPFYLVLSSPLSRARSTAELAGLEPYELEPDLHEWDYGELEGLTTAEIRASLPGWQIWSGPWPGGETADDVAARADGVLERVRRSGAGRVALVAHGHILRVLAARWLGEGPAAGRLLALDTAAICELGWEHEAAVIRTWNLTASRLSAAS